MLNQIDVRGVDEMFKFPRGEVMNHIGQGGWTGTLQPERNMDFVTPRQLLRASDPGESTADDHYMFYTHRKTSSTGVSIGDWKRMNGLNSDREESLRRVRTLRNTWRVSNAGPVKSVLGLS